MRYNNIKNVVSLYLPNDKGYHYSIAKTGKAFYVVLVHGNNIITDKFSSLDICLKYIEQKLVQIINAEEKLGTILPSYAECIKLSKLQSLREFSY